MEPLIFAALTVPPLAAVVMFLVWLVDVVQRRRRPDRRAYVRAWTWLVPFAVTVAVYGFIVYSCSNMRI